ncbi:MAG: hypothetical protein M0Z52_02615 [Actinomycetota bacterium]|nr:hypothetical protein [Actinomycetota bacterium]
MNGARRLFHNLKTFHVAVLLAVAFAVYANSLPNSFNFDDGMFVTNNSAVHGFTLGNLKAVFTSVPNQVEYLPIKDLTYMLDYEIWKLNPLGYHITNLVFYLLVIAVLYFLFVEIFSMAEINGQADRRRACWTAFLAALIYSVHPAHVESVAGISQRKDLVSGLFYFSGLLIYLKGMRRNGWGHYAASLFLLVLAVLSKMTAVLMPVSVLMAEIYFGRGTLGKKLARTVPFFIVAGGLAALGIFIAKYTGVYSTAAAGPLRRIPGALEAFFVYLKMLAWPYPLKVWYKFTPDGSFFNILPILSFTGLACLISLIVLLAKRGYKAVSFGAAWALASLIPVVGLIPTTVVIAERYAFIPSAGFCIAAAWALARIFMLPKPLYKATVAAVAAIAITAFCVISFERNFDWKDNVTLLEADLSHKPDLLKTYSSLGRIYFSRGDYRKGLAYLLREKQLQPDNVEYDFFTADYLYRTGQPGMALEILKGLKIGIKAEVTDIDYLCGLIYESQGMRQKAIENYQKALYAGIQLGSFPKADARAALARLGAVPAP